MGYRQLINTPPKTFPWAEVVDFQKLDERLSCIDCLYTNIIGVNDGEVEWCPNDDPPSKEETLAWLWFIRPDLSGEITNDAPQKLKYLMESYRHNEMENWWKELTKEN